MGETQTTPRERQRRSKDRKARVVVASYAPWEDTMSLTMAESGGVDGWVWALAAAWVASPLGAFACFVLMRYCMAAINSRDPFILHPATKTACATAQISKLRVVAINMCLLPGGLSFSGSWLIDGNDRKMERIDMLLKLLDDYDVILLNELWGCWWSSFHTLFLRHAVDRGFFVCGTPVTLPPFNSLCPVACLACWS